MVFRWEMGEGSGGGDGGLHYSCDVYNIFRRLHKLHEDYSYLKDSFDQFKKREEATKLAEKQRNELLRTREDKRTDVFANPKPTNEGTFLHETNFLQRTEYHLDTFLATGRSVLGDLHQQGHTMKTAHRKLLDAANVLGISGNIIRYIERRSTQDKWVLFGLFILLLLSMYFVVRFLW
jgi:golgi SNAP receptor complex member 2